MAPISAVILPLDFSVGAERAVAPAGAVAAHFGVRVLPVTSRFGWGDRDPAIVLARLTSDIAELTDPPTIEDRFAPNAIAHTVRDTPGALVCMATQGRSGVARLAGSVAEEVLQQVGTPVLLVGPAATVPDPTADTGPVLVCVDGSDAALAILPFVEEWLGTTAQAAELFYVAPDARDAEEARGWLHDLTMGHVDLADRLSCLVVEHPDAAVAVVERARAARSPLVAMATHGTTGLARVVLGSVTASVVRDAPCPVLTVRPRSLRPSR